MVLEYCIHNVMHNYEWKYENTSIVPIDNKLQQV